MEVTVRFYSLFLAYVPEAEITVKMQKENPTVADLIDELNEKLGEDFSRELGERIKTDPQMLKLIHIGQNNLKMREGLNTPLEEGDTVKFLPPMEGGGRVRR